MTRRHIFLDVGVGETRGVVMLDDRPERLIVQRSDDDPRLALGARLIARVASLEPSISTAFLDLGDGAEAILPFKADTKPVRGAALEVEIRSEPRVGKLAVAKRIGDGEGAPRLLSPSLGVATILRQLVRDESPIEGREARAAADEAEAEVLETIHPLPGGGSLAIEPTRALTAVDVDLGERKGQDPKRVTRQTNLSALYEAARLLRLKGLGGLVVLDLAGRGHDSAALMAAARLAFGPDNPGVAIGPIGRFGTLEISIPRRTRPVRELLLRADGAPSDRLLVQRLIRRIEDEAVAQPGARIVARAESSIAAAAQPYARLLAEKIGARFSIIEQPGMRELLDVGPA